MTHRNKPTPPMPPPIGTRKESDTECIRHYLVSSMAHSGTLTTLATCVDHAWYHVARHDARHHFGPPAPERVSRTSWHARKAAGARFVFARTEMGFEISSTCVPHTVPEPEQRTLILAARRASPWLKLAGQ